MADSKGGVQAVGWLSRDNAASVVTSFDGRRKVKFGTFRTLRAQDYKAFGLELSGSRRGAKKPYLRMVVVG